MKITTSLIGKPLLRAVVGFVLLLFFTMTGRAQLGTIPIIAVQPANVNVQVGDTAIFTVTVAPSLTQQKFYWFYNGQPLATNKNSVIVSNSTTLDLNLVSTLILDKANPSKAGLYSVRVTNGVGGTVSANADLSVTTPGAGTVTFVNAGAAMTTAGFKLQLSASTGSNVVVEASSDMINWVPISTNTATSGSVSVTDAAALTNHFRFYRAKLQ